MQPNRPLFTLLIGATLLLSACAPGLTAAPPVEMATLTPASTATPGPTSSARTQIPALEPGTLAIDEQCARELSAPPAPAGDGVLLLQDSRQSLISLLDLKSGKLTQLPKDYDHVLGLSISPNREWLAYSTFTITKDSNELQIFIAGPDGAVHKKYPSNLNWLLSGWLDDDRLLIHVNVKPGVDPQFATLFLNPFTGARKQLEDNYPNINLLPPRHLFPTYPPDLSRVIYPIDLDLVLYDLDNKRPVTRIPDVYHAGVQAGWSPDANNVAVVSHGYINEGASSRPILIGFFVIGRDGQIVQWTKVAGLQGFALESFTWSPDSSRLAFWMDSVSPVGKNDTHRTTTELMVFDVAGNQGVDHCVTGIIGSAVWSPDGSRITFMRPKQEDEKQYDVMVLDLKSNTYWKVAENVELAGWLKGP